MYHYTQQMHEISNPKREGLIYFTRVIQQLNGQPAQALRTAEILYPKHYRLLCKTGSEILATRLAEIVLQRLTPTHILNCQRVKPHHFLTHTQFHRDSVTQTFNSPTPTMFFVRTQRRYNKRRYARVRAVSRPSFWSGMMVSTVATSAFWGATLQSLQWITTLPVVPDINTAMALIFLYILWRLFRLHTTRRIHVYREKNKSARGFTHVIKKRAPLL